VLRRNCIRENAVKCHSDFAVVEEAHEECRCVTGAEIGDISKNDYILG
jgi:hypothetical protein